MKHRKVLSLGLVSRAGICLGLLALSPMLTAGLLEPGGIKRIAARTVLGAQRLKRRRIAVLQFPYIDGRACDGPRAVAELLTTSLAVRKDIEVVERASLGQLIEELELKQRGLLDDRASYELGQFLDVDAVLTGTLLELPDGQMQLNARLIRIPDGLIVTAADGVIDRTWQDAAALPRPPPQRWLEALFAPIDEGSEAKDDLARLFQQQMDASIASSAKRAVP